MKSFIVMGFCYISPGINETRTSLYRQSTEAARQWQMLAGNENLPCLMLLAGSSFSLHLHKSHFQDSRMYVPVGWKKYAWVEKNCP